MTGGFAWYWRGAVVLLLVVGAAWSPARAEEPQFAWKSVFQLSPPKRLDAITDLGGGKVLVGSREPFPGHIAASDDFGQTWTEYGGVINGHILNLLALDSQTVLASTGEGEIWKSEDEGISWRKTQKLTNFALYSMAVTNNGVVLTATNDQNGGRVYRSTDGGETWSQAHPAATSPEGLYRFQRVEDGVLLNGWAGHLYKSFDDGLTWTDLGQISSDPLYPIESLPTGVVLLGDERGKIFRSTDNGLTWNTVADVKQPLDDFVWVNDELVYLSSYSGTKHLFVSHDAGVTWSDIGPTPDRDVLDHVIRLRDAPTPVAVGGTTEGRILRLEVVTTSTWHSEGSGLWKSDSNWNPIASPIGNDKTAIFGNAITAPSTVAVDSAVKVREIQFDHTISYVIAGSSAITLEANTGNASIKVLNAGGPVTHEFQARVNLADNTTVDVAANTTLEMNNRVNLGAFNINKVGTGTLRINNEVVSSGGTVNLGGGAIGGIGSIGGDLNNLGGTVAPGNSPGVLAVAGDYRQSTGGKLQIELSGLSRGDDYDVLNVGGAVLLDGGVLEVLLINGFAPSQGNVFDVLDFSSLSGRFDEIRLPEGFRWDTSQLLVNGSLAVGAVVPEPASIILLGMAAFVTLRYRKGGGYRGRSDAFSFLVLKGN